MFRPARNVIILAAIITLAPLAVTGQSMTRPVTLQGQAAYSRISPPTSGVKLIEDIFQRVRSAPQIAMAKNLYKQQLELPQQQQSGPTDYRYAIRPKKSAGRTVAMRAPSLNLVAPEGMDAISANFGGAAGTMIASRSAAEPVTEQWMGARQFPVVARESNAKNNSGVWEIPQQEARQEKKSRDDGFYMEQAAGKPQQQQVMDLKTTAGRLLNLTAKMEQVQRMAEQQMANAPAAPGASLRMAKRPEVSEARFRGQQGADRNMGEKESDAGAMLADEEALNDMSRSAGAKAKRDVARAKDKDSLSRSRLQAPAANEGLFSNERMNKAKIAMADIALLPPNVVTGIPLVRLGISEFQANSALQQIGSMKQQKVNKWTVWSWNRPQGKSGTSLQLYMRNGLLDAMRIFDQTLIGPDFGVTLGDSLARVKEKFGEPAFILQEPGPGAGQNYIYPISQVGFQLARPAPGDQPRVVSLLIFNVK